MMRRAFTLVELMVASAISAVILAALSMALTGVWREALKTNEEIQTMFKASAMRERLLVGTASAGSKGFHGLLNVTNMVAATNSKRNLTIYKADNTTADSDESLPGKTSALVFGKASSGDKNGVTVLNLGTVTNTFDYAEIRQRAVVYLWVQSAAGTVCRMPVYMTMVRDAPQEGN